jgi:hypothetical protein
LTRAAAIARRPAAVVTLPATAAAVLLPAAAVSAGRTLTLGHAFHRVDQCGRNHHNGRDKQ